MTLTTIADLDQPEAALAPYLKMAESLSDTYYHHIAEREGAYKYTVEIFGGGSGARKPGIHASEISKCERIMVYSLSSTERKRDASTADVNMEMRFSLGHAVHAMLQNDWHRIAKASGGTIKFEDEVRIHPGLGGKAAEWTLMSSCDGIITTYDSDGNPLVRIGLEIKTESADQFAKLKSPRPDHEEQTCLYMAALDLPLMWVFYYNKSNSNITPSASPWLFRFNKKLWEENLEMRFARAQHHAEAGTLPPRKEGRPCSWCPYSYICGPKILQHKKPVQISRGMGAKK